MRQISKGFPIWQGRRGTYNENVLWSVCGNADRQSELYIQIYATTYICFANKCTLVRYHTSIMSNYCGLMLIH